MRTRCSEASARAYAHVLVHANDDVLPVAATPVPAGQFVHDDLPVSEL